MAELKSFTCVLCNDKYKSKEELNDHFRTHANKSNQTKLQKETNQKSIKSDVNNEKIPCDVCQLEFKSISIAIQHKYRKHPDAIMKFFCKFCGMQFPLQTTHNKHLNIHSDETAQGDFPCPDCNAQFVTETGRIYHIKSAHNRVTSLIKPVNTPPPSKKIRLNNANEAQSVYYCYLCGVPYINKFNLQRHLEKNHTENERNSIPADMLKCTTCDALFYTKQAYDCHVFDHKPDDLYVTSEEQRLQTVARVDQDFDIRRVQLPTEKFIPNFKACRKSTITTKHTVKKLKKTTSSDEELSPASEIESSDDELLLNNTSKNITFKKTNKNKVEGSGNISGKSENSKNIVKKRFYAILDSNGTVTQTCTTIPEKGILTKTNVIKLKNSDILKTLQKSDMNNIKIKLSQDRNLKQTIINNRINNMCLKKAEYNVSILEQNKIDESDQNLSAKNSKNIVTFENRTQNNDELITQCNSLIDKDKSTLSSNKVNTFLTDKTLQNSKLNQQLKVVLNRLPVRYENILQAMKKPRLESTNTIL